MRDSFASFSLLVFVVGLGLFAVFASPAVMPDYEGLEKCLKLHPERYCRIANGFAVPSQEL